MKLRRFEYFAAVVLVLTGLQRPAFTDEREVQVDQIFAPYTVPGTPGASIAVLLDGEVILSKGYGLAQLEHGIPITPETVFHVASVSKQFTAFAVVLLAQAGKLSLDDDIHVHLPEVQGIDDAITIRQLIYHTSGLRDQWDLLGLAGWRMDDVITEGDILELVSRQRELNFPPGSRMLYCNTGYTLLSVIVARVSGQSFQDFCQEHIFAPLEMAHTHVHADHQHVVPMRAYSYAPGKGGAFENRVMSFSVSGATSLFTTPEDLLRWQANFETKKVGDSAAIEIMGGPGHLSNGSEMDYGYGLAFGTYRGWRTISHSGGDAGFRSYLMHFPERNLAIALAGNLATLNTDALCREVAGVYLPDVDGPSKAPGQPYSFLPAAAPLLESCEGHFFNSGTTDVIRFRVLRDKLKLLPRRGGAVELGQISATGFRPVSRPDSMLCEFSFDRGGKVDAVVLTRGAEAPLTYLPVDTVEGTPAYLDTFSGEYFSEELDVKYGIVLENGRLFLERRKFGRDLLRPQIEDGFSADVGFIHFSRNEAGGVTGFRLNTGRILNLRFVRAQ